jgi:hypothetical protein
MYSSTRFPGGKMKYCHVLAGKKSFFTSRDGPPLSSLTQRRNERNVKPGSLIYILSKKGDVLAGFMASSRRCGGA